LVLAVCLSGCQKKDTRTWAPGQPLDKDSLKVGIVYLDGARGGYSLAHDLGIVEAQLSLGLRDNQIMRKLYVNAAEPGMVESALADLIAMGANIIIATSWGFMDASESMSAKYPNVIFAHASGYKNNETNFKNYFGRIYQARYLGGIVAGLKTKSGKIGYVAAMDTSNSEVTGGINAFAMGVESVNPKAKIYVNVTNDWYNPAADAQSARRLIGTGCDVIAQHVDTPQPQFEAEKANVWGIGYNVDMTRDAPKAVITSVVWNWGNYYVRLLRSVIDGSFTTESHFGGMEDGMVDISPLNPALALPGMEEAVAEAKKRILTEGFGIFDGVMETNDGRKVGTEGATLPDAEITGGINWYYRNVVEFK